MAPARAPGGDGIERELEMLEPVTVSLITERRVVAAVGPRTAASPARWARTGCCPAATRRTRARLPDKCTVRLEAGDVLRILTPGGGGWGRPPDGRAEAAGD